jgi:hypothetical protein
VNAATVHPNTCSYNYAIFSSGNIVHFTGGSSCPGGAWVTLYKVSPGGSLQFVAFGNGDAVYTCPGTTISAYQGNGTQNGVTYTLTNVPCS